MHVDRSIGADVPACLLSLTARGTEAGDKLELVQDHSISGTPALLVNPGIAVSTAEVFAAWDGVDRGPLGDWREGRNDLEEAARSMFPAISNVLDAAAFLLERMRTPEGRLLHGYKDGQAKFNGYLDDYANLIEGGLATSNDKLKQNPDRIFRLIRAGLKGINFFVTKREPAIKYMSDALKLTDRELISSIYDIQSKLILREGFSDDTVLQSMIDAMKKTTKVQRDIKVSDVFDLSLVKKANEELKSGGWKP